MANDTPEVITNWIPAAHDHGATPVVDETPVIEEVVVEEEISE